MSTKRKMPLRVNRITLERSVVVILFLLALVLFHFANKGSERFKQLYEKSTGKKVE